MHHIILYYYFTPISEPKRFCQLHKRTCQLLNLKGRVYVAREGINGTLAGLPEDIALYKEYLRALPGFENTAFKDDTHDSMPFAKLIVKTRPEIVTLKSDIPVDPTKQHGKYLEPEEWRQLLESQEDFTLLDVRNDSETKIGHFEGAVKPEVNNFYDFPQWLDQAKLDKNKKVLMYCTGGIRCEKFSLLMQKKGFKDVYQLHGGILNYAKQVGDAHYKGKCFVFDDRLSVPVEKNQKEPLARCEITGQPCDSYLNCANMDCNRLFICSEEGAQKYQGCCSEKCMNVKRRRPFDPENIYAPSLKWYMYYEDKSAINGVS